MIAVPAPRSLCIGIASALTALVVLASGPAPHAPVLDIAPAAEPIEVPTPTEAPIDVQPTTTVVIHGCVTSRDSGDNHVAIQLPGMHHVYGAITDGHGCFELRIPIEDLAVTLCERPAAFDDRDMALRYRCSFE